MKKIIGNSRRPDISFYNDGRIDITSHIARLLSLQAGDVIDVLIHDTECLLFVAKKHNNIIGRYEAQCSPTQKGSHNFRCYSKKLCNAIINECNSHALRNNRDNCTIAKLLCGEPTTIDGYVYIPIITMNNLKTTMI